MIRVLSKSNKIHYCEEKGYPFCSTLCGGSVEAQEYIEDITDDGSPFHMCKRCVKIEGKMTKEREER